MEMNDRTPEMAPKICLFAIFPNKYGSSNINVGKNQV